MTLIITHPDTSTDQVATGRASVDRKLNEITTARVEVPREDLNAITVNEQEDDAELIIGGTTEFEGVVRDIDRRSSSIVTLHIDSFERRAKQAQPTSQKSRFLGVADTTIVQQAIDNIPQLTAGTLENIKSDIDVEFSHASPARMIRVVRDITGGEIRYNNDKTVDYISRIGSDKSGSITIDPDNSNVTQFRSQQAGGQDAVNHLRCVGGGTGDATVVVDVIAPSYSPGDLEIWGQAQNKELTFSDALREFGNEIIAERETEYVEVTATTIDEPIEHGDSVQVTYSEEDINTSLRAVETTRSWTQTGETVQFTGSTRSLSRTRRADKVSRDIDRLNRMGGSKVISTYDDPTVGPQEEGSVIYVTGVNASYPRGIYYHNGTSYESTVRGDVDSDSGTFETSFVVPVGGSAQDGAVLPTGTDRYDTT